MNYEKVIDGLDSMDSKIRNKSLTEIVSIIQGEICAFYHKVIDEVNIQFKPFVDNEMLVLADDYKKMIVYQLNNLPKNTTTQN